MLDYTQQKFCWGQSGGADWGRGLPVPLRTAPEYGSEET